jgi:hypothetical protein
VWALTLYGAWTGGLCCVAAEVIIDHHLREMARAWRRCTGGGGVHQMSACCVTSAV